jgi:hypothetical protein
VKVTLLPKIGLRNALPSVLKLTFWEIELNNGDSFSALGIPSNAEIKLEQNETKQIIVTLPNDTIQVLNVTNGDRIASLKVLLAPMISKDVGDFVFLSSNNNVDGSQLISQLPELRLKVTTPFVDVPFEAVNGVQHSVKLRPDATVRDARNALAVSIGKSNDSVFLIDLDNSSVPDDQLLSSATGPLRISYLREMSFDFQGQKLRIPIDFAAPISTVKKTVSARLHLPEADFSLLFGDAEIDDDMSLDDFEPTTEDYLTIKLINATPPLLPSDHLRDFNRMPVVRILKNSPSSVVKLVRDNDMNCEIVVRWQVPPIGEESSFALKLVEQISWLTRCSHPCLLKFFGWSFPTESSPGKFGMEYARGGNLRDFQFRKDNVDETVIAIIVCGIVQGMKYLHQQNIIHRDLRPENIFLDCSGFPKIGGFEKARLLSVDLTLTSDNNSSLYLAPELYGTENIDELAPSVDVYSFGMILYELIVGQPVFPLHTPLGKLHSLAAGTERPELPPEMCFALKQIIQQSWSANPVIRNSFDLIWRQLEVVNFAITPGVDVERVMTYIQQIT